LQQYSYEEDKVRAMQSHSSESLFGESFRPRVHFTPYRNWMNDPNGLLYYKGKYHLFYQHNPQGNLWGNMSWGHATSSDLLHWEHLPVAIGCDETYGIFSGSAVVDYTNSSGLGTVENPPMVAIYTAHNHDGSHQSQHIAYSLDEGVTWTKYADNPVLDLGMKDFRDPKVTYEEATHTWLMTVAKPEEFKISFFRSHNLKQWEHLSDFGPLGATGGCWECPDLFSLEINGARKWVLIVSLNPGGYSGGSGTQYFIGEWEGQSFTPDSTDTRWIDHGRDNYAGVTFNNHPEGKRIFLGWMSNWIYADKYPTELWRSSMTLPRELSLQLVDGELSLISTPINSSDELTRHELQITQGVSSEITFRDDKNFLTIAFDALTQEVVITRSWFIEDAPQRSLPITADSAKLSIYLDNGSCEIFCPEIGLAMTSLTLLPIEAVREPFTFTTE
jgi:sucrose-6-phosphate hydrolase SacC (GH32 family)